MNKEDRQNLTALIEANGGADWWDPQEFQASVRAKLPTQLQILSVPPSPASNYNCFVYALGLEGRKAFLGGNNPVQKEFIQHLLNKGVLGLVEKPTEGDLIFYKDEGGTITHGGIVSAGGKISSKWMWGALFSHETWDVPSSFGDIVFYTNRPLPEVLEKEYEDYKNSGAIINPIQ